jgi:plasmid stabilization system protein ParE
MTLRITPRARDDLRQIMEYIAKETRRLQIASVGRFFAVALSRDIHIAFIIS